jgi:CHAD domain-containing protein
VLKKLRYITEFLAGLFDESQVRKFVNRLKSLQGFLGHANDVRVAYDLLDEVQAKTDHDVRAIDRAGGIVLGWYERGIADREPKIRRRVREFKHLKPFW